MPYRDPELDAIMNSMIDHRNRCDECGMGHWARPMDRAIMELIKHPYFEGLPPRRKEGE